MAADLNHLLAHLMLDVYAAQMPAGSILELRTGAPPSAEAAATGTLLVSITIPATPWAAPAAGVLAKQGVWSSTGVAAGNVGHYWFKNAAGTRIEAGTVTITGGGGDATIDNVSVAVSQVVTVNTFNKTL